MNLYGGVLYYYVESLSNVNVKILETQNHM